MPGPKRWTSRLFVGWRRSHGGWAAALRAKPETLLHVSALLLAPISVVQPIGILAVPVGVMLTARGARAWPSQRVMSGVALAVAGTVAFVVLSTLGTAPTSVPVTVSGLGVAVLIVAVVIGGLRLAASRLSGALRCLAFASMGAAGYGFGSSLIRVIARATSRDLAAWLSPLVIMAALTMVCSITVGAWAVQQAYASGPAPVVTSALTVGDPLVAILLSAGLFGEGLHQGAVVLVFMVVCAAVAASGVWLLARYQPAGGPRPSQTSPTLTTSL